MSVLKPDPTFYPSARHAMQAVPERYGYVVTLNWGNGKSDGLAVVDLDPQSPKYSQIVYQLNFPKKLSEYSTKMTKSGKLFG